MNIKSNGQEVSRLINEIELRVEQFQACRVDGERWEECAEVERRLEELCGEGRMRIGGADVGLLVALMDAYEVIRDEGMLQEVLDAVGEMAEELEASPLHVKLLSYCYFYTEDEECADLAGQLLERLKTERNLTEKELEEAQKVYRELVKGIY